MATDALKAQVRSKWQDAFKRINSNNPGITGLMAFSEVGHAVVHEETTQHLFSKQSWSHTLAFVKPINIKEDPPPKRADITTARRDFEVVNYCRRLPSDWCLDDDYMFSDEIRQKFYLVREDIDSYLSDYELSKDLSHISRLILRLKEWYDAWTPPEELGATIRNAFVLVFQTQLYSSLGPTFVKGFKDLIASTFPSSDPDIPSQTLDASTWVIFETLGFLDRYENIIASAGYEHIEAHVLEACAGQWETPMMDTLRTWMSEKVVPWLLLMYGRDANTTDEARALLSTIGSRFDFHVAKTLCDLRTREIFDIIVDYPDSAGALQDLKECLQRVDQRGALVKSLRKANRKRLLHPGAETRLILTQYVATIKCLRIVDPPGVLLFKVADPIRRERPDTIRCIVSNLVGDDDSGDSLVDESEPIVPLQQADTEDYTDPNWEPEPVDAGPDFRTNKPSDVISTLVSIYDSRDLFVKELQVLLAQRLLAITDDSTEKVEKERRNIEILKIRFGEAALQVCEVMLKDMTDSKRIDGHVQSQKASIVHPTIISRQFWPMLESSEIVMPGQFQILQDQYAKEFSTFKPDKRLRWLPHLGTVHLELQLEDRMLEVDVPPLEAAFIELFSEKNIRTIDELINAVGSVDKSAAFKALLAWVDLGVLKEDEPGTFRLLEVAEEAGPARDSSSRIAPTTEQDLAPVTSLQQQQAEQMKVYWKFIEGMLTNLGQLPLDRIQTMLRFAPGYDQTIEQLAGFMEAARREGLVGVKDGLWKLTPR
ncbi:hypothetical protein D9758_014343 [Tetrapyrgos nigripes]|uniref:Anaphase-promoting complex subunit 2 n=1 Tax=Tetrapyrgos nigripes TaxID=182062 RepID=A0A8H5C6P3_9AGAR|nr:hypothetical protein D9758_014343 [Tetrapyrgos nigripes]